jgi:hypothetical protein
MSYDKSGPKNQVSAKEEIVVKIKDLPKSFGLTVK